MSSVLFHLKVFICLDRLGFAQWAYDLPRLWVCFVAPVQQWTVSAERTLNVLNTINTWLHSEAERRRPRPAWNLLPWGVRACTYLSKRLLRGNDSRSKCILAKSQGLSPAFRLSCSRHSRDCKMSSCFRVSWDFCGHCLHTCSSSCLLKE